MQPIATWTWRLVRVAVGIALTAWIVHRIGLRSLTLDFRNWPRGWPLLMGAAELVYLGVYLLGIARWRVLMRSQAIGLSFKRAFSLFFIGHFFNAFMLGSAGGDLIKAWAVARETHHRKTEAATLVFLDRLLGLIALIFLVMAVLAIRAPLLRGPSAIRGAAVFLLMLAGGVGVALFALFHRNWLESPAWQRLAASPRLPRALLAHAARVYEAGYRLRQRPGLLARAFALALGVHLLSLLANFLFAVAIGSGLSPLQALTLYPLVGAMGALPLTPGGLGVREGAAVLIFGAVGIPPLTAVLLSLLPFLGITLWSLFGGLLYLRDSWRPHRPLP